MTEEVKEETPKKKGRPFGSKNKPRTDMSDAEIYKSASYIRWKENWEAFFTECECKNFAIRNSNKDSFLADINFLHELRMHSQGKKQGRLKRWLNKIWPIHE